MYDNVSQNYVVRVESTGQEVQLLDSGLWGQKDRISVEAGWFEQLSHPSIQMCLSQEGCISGAGDPDRGTIIIIFLSGENQESPSNGKCYSSTDKRKTCTPFCV